jgi:sporulation protein YlmC with PRC-barrel domain
MSLTGRSRYGLAIVTFIVSAALSPLAAHAQNSDASPANVAPAPAQNPDNGTPVPQSPTPGIPAVVMGGVESEGIMGKPVKSKTGEDLGRIVDVIIDRNAQVRGVVIEIGGFVGVGSRQVAVSWSALHRATPPQETPADNAQNKSSGKLEPLVVDFTRDQLGGAPAYKAAEQTVLLNPPDQSPAVVPDPTPATAVQGVAPAPSAAATPGVGSPPSPTPATSSLPATGTSDTPTK